MGVKKSGKGRRKLGRKKRHAVVTFEFEIDDYTQYDLFAADTVIKARLRFNGPLISGTYYHYVEVDVYGTLDDLEWGEHAESNRTIKFTTLSEYDSTLGADFSMKIQNTRSGL